MHSRFNQQLKEQSFLLWKSLRKSHFADVCFVVWLWGEYCFLTANQHRSLLFFLLLWLWDYKQWLQEVSEIKGDN